MSNNITIDEILKIEGIVIRLIPKITINYWLTYNEPRKLKDNEQLVTIDGRQCIKEKKFNSLGGKYLVIKEKDQGNIIRYCKATCGIGDTIIDAFNDYQAKNKEQNQ